MRIRVALAIVLVLAIIVTALDGGRRRQSKRGSKATVRVKVDKGENLAVEIFQPQCTEYNKARLLNLGHCV